MAAAALVLAVAFLALAGARPLNVPDEGRYAGVALEMLRTGDWITPRLDHVPFLDKPPLLYWLDGLGLSLFGATPFGARFAVALMGVVGALCVLLAGTRLSGWREGLLGAGVLATTPLWVGGSLYVNQDLTVATGITAATLSLALAFAPGGPPSGAEARHRQVSLGWLAVGGAAAALAVLTKGLIGLVFPFGSVGLWLVATRRTWSVGWLLPSFFLAVALAAPWFLACQRANPGFFRYFFVVQHFQRFLGKGFNNPTGPAFYLLVVPAGLVPWTPFLPGAVARAWRAFRRDGSDARGDLLLLLWPALVIAFFSIPTSKIVGYVLPAIPPLAMLMGRWWHEELALAARPRPALGAATALLVGILGAATLALPAVFPAAVRSAAPFPGPASVALWLTGALLLAAAAMAWRSLRAGRARRALAVLAASTAIWIAALLAAVPAVVPPGTERLAARLAPLLREGDTVVAWRRYFYDLDFLLDRPEPLVVAEPWDDPGIAREDSWRHELWTGRGWRPESAAWLVSPEAAVARCTGAARCFFVARAGEAQALQARLPLVTMARQGGVVLLATPAAAP